MSRHAVRCPNSADPIRTIVAPSAIAASRSSDIPIDSVSTASPAARQDSNSAENPELAAPGRHQRVGSAMPIRPRKFSCGSAATARASASAVSGRNAAFVDSPLMLTCTHTLRGGFRAAASRTAGPRCAPGRWCAPSRSARPRRRLVALERADEVPFHVRKVDERAHFRQGFLHVVLPEGPLPQPVERPDRPRRKRLADGKHPDAFLRAAGLPHGPKDTIPHVLPRLLVVEHNRMTPA